MEKKDKHTQGEWWVPDYTPIESVVAGHPSDPNIICVVRPNDILTIQDDAQCDANAHLIAAAPELLNACDRAVLAIESLMDELGNKRPTDWGMVNAAMIALGKARAKARETN